MKTSEILLRCSHLQPVKLAKHRHQRPDERMSALTQNDSRFVILLTGKEMRQSGRTENDGRDRNHSAGF